MGDEFEEEAGVLDANIVEEINFRLNVEESEAKNVRALSKETR